jgi:hypothetical protein
MSISLAFLTRCAAETGFRPETLEKVVRLGEVAEDIARHPWLGTVLVLKGGTALNLCLGTPRRLSVDLDFNYVASAERRRMLQDRPKVEEALTQIAQRRGYRVQRSAEAHANRKLFLHYRSVHGGGSRVEIDVNFLFRVPLGAVRRRPLWQPGRLDRPEVAVLANEELAVGKLLALLDRVAPRDAWDVANLEAPIITLLGASSFRALFVALSAILPRPLSEYRRERLERLTDRRMREQLEGMLTREERLDAAELRQRVWSVLDPILALSEEEAEYVRAVNERGELPLSLLFSPGDELLPRLEVHPALQWKIANVRAHLARRQGGG